MTPRECQGLLASINTVQLYWEPEDTYGPEFELEERFEEISDNDSYGPVAGQGMASEGDIEQMQKKMETSDMGMDPIKARRGQEDEIMNEEPGEIQQEEVELIQFQNSIPEHTHHSLDIKFNNAVNDF